MADDAPLLLDVTRLVWRRWAGRHPTGIDRVCLAYLERFAPEAQAVVHHRRFRRILDQRSSAELFRILLDPPRRFRPALIAGGVRRLGGEDCAGRGRPYLNIGHTGLDSVGFRRWVARADIRPVYFVHDLIPITHPEFCRTGEAERHKNRMRTVLQSAAGVIGNSQATLDELHQFARDEQMSFPPSVAAWLGLTPLECSDRGVSEPQRPTFVVLGTIEARKNHLLLLRIWAGLVRALGSTAPRLLIIGQRGWEAQAAFEMLDRDDGLKDHVVELNHCSDDELAGHLRTARALLFPSEAEGFGLPLIEALALGVPVIASELPAFGEIGQGIPDLVSPRDEAAWEAAILDYAQPDSEARAAQLRRMRHFRLPTWDEHFRRVERWLSALPFSSRDAPRSSRPEC